MNTCFFDQNKKVVIKVLNDASKVKREICGAKTFAQFVQTPDITQLDTKTILIAFSDGLDSSNVKNSVLNELIIQMLNQQIASRNLDDLPFSIVDEIQTMQYFYRNDLNSQELLEEIVSSIEEKSFYPVHGDLQKQNIFIKNGELVLIDFEHFTLAPIELEIVNSLFFRDANCLDVRSILPFCLNSGMMKAKTIKHMLNYYALRQLSLGRAKKDVESKLNRGITLLNEIIESMALSKEENSYYNWTSSCFA